MISDTAIVVLDRLHCNLSQHALSRKVQKHTGQIYCSPYRSHILLLSALKVNRNKCRSHQRHATKQTSICFVYNIFCHVYTVFGVYIQVQAFLVYFFLFCNSFGHVYNSYCDIKYASILHAFILIVFVGFSTKHKS